jgi:hypothetical protein
MYGPRSESSHMFHNNHEDDASVYSPESGNFKDERMERKKRKREERERELTNLKHIRIKSSDLPPSEDEEEDGEEEDEDLAPTKFDNELEPSLMTGTPGNYGALTSLANQARGPGFAGGHAFAMGEPMDIAFQLLKREERQGFVGAGKKPRKKRGAKERKEHKERQKKWRPSTGQFQRPPGGMTPRGATTRRAKARMRGIKSGKKTGLGRAHLAVEMSHRGVKTKQPMSKDPRRYRQYMGQQEARKRLGNIRTVAATPSRFGGRSYRAGLTGGGTLQSLLPGQAQQMRRPSLRAHRPPPLIPPRIPGIPQLPQPSIPSPPPIPQATRGVGVQNMAGQGAMYTPSRVPTASVQGGYPSPSPPASIMMGKIGEGSDLQKRGLSYYDMAELRQLINEARRAMKRKDSKKKGKGEKSIDAASHLPAHTEAGPLRTTRNEGGTEDETDARRFGINPLDHLTSRGGRTP